MDGVHDLGGRQGFGPIDPDTDEPVFHSDWERRVLEMFPAMAGAGAFNLDQFRYGMEQIPPAEYLASTLTMSMGRPPYVTVARPPRRPDR